MDEEGRQDYSAGSQQHCDVRVWEAQHGAKGTMFTAILERPEDLARAGVGAYPPVFGNYQCAVRFGPWGLQKLRCSSAGTELTMQSLLVFWVLRHIFVL